MKDKIKLLNDKIALAKLGGGEKRIAKQSRIYAVNLSSQRKINFATKAAAD